MKILPLERVQLKEIDQARLQDNIGNFTNQLMLNPFLKGNLIEGVSLSTTATQLEHKLGLTPLGYIIVSQSASASIFTTAKDQNFLTLQASASVTVNIWVF